VAHNDTKLNNVLLDDVTGEGVCVIDLDTVMPGLFLHDFGDLVRTAATSAAEDEPDVSKVEVDPALFAALARGACEGLDGRLTAFERESLALAGRVITFECGSRFLADHLLGDRYFKVHRQGHNLDRARAQLALLQSMERRDAELRDAAAAALR
jgi:Ser/Thr protein kinase RdoA (MazF antagonist)